MTGWGVQLAWVEISKYKDIIISGSDTYLHICNYDSCIIEIITFFNKTMGAMDSI